jgi:hypothetical protein
VGYNLLVPAVPDDKTPDSCKARLDQEINDAQKAACGQMKQ